MKTMVSDNGQIAKQLRDGSGSALDPVARVAGIITIKRPVDELLDKMRGPRPKR
jgi:hypothetical protein